MINWTSADATSQSQDCIQFDDEVACIFISAVHVFIILCSTQIIAVTELLLLLFTISTSLASDDG